MEYALALKQFEVKCVPVDVHIERSGILWAILLDGISQTERALAAGRILFDGCVWQYQYFELFSISRYEIGNSPQKEVGKRYGAGNSIRFINLFIDAPTRAPLT